jgi:aldehyde:ferredoxin oxidoreductase
MLYTLATGDNKDRKGLDDAGMRIFLLHRALTIRGMGTKEMRTRHDRIPAWVYEDKTGKATFTKGTTCMDREDVQTALDMFYDELGWDKATGAPTRSTYRRFGLDSVGAALAGQDLAPR